MRARIMAMMAVLALASCGQQANDTATGQAIDSVEVREAGPPAPAEPGGDPAQAATVATRIAYAYSYRYKLPGDRLAEVAAAHRKLCDDLGPTRCQLISASLEGRDGAYSRGALQLRVAPALARTFGERLGTIVTGADGDLIQSGVTGEDLTRAVIDAEAALTAKRTLRDRLQALLANRQGKLAELLEVERALAQTQQELDAATALIAELRQRLDLSRVDIAYESELPAPSSDARPLANALGGVSDVFETSLAVLIQAVAALLPFALLGGAVWAVVRWRRGRRAGRETRAEL